MSTGLTSRRVLVGLGRRSGIPAIGVLWAGYGLKRMTSISKANDNSTSSHAPETSTSTSGDAIPPKPTGLVMQIILRRDLITTHGWPIGPLLAQSAHAATAVLHIHRDLPQVQKYLKGEDGRGWECMRKVTMEVNDEKTIHELAEKLDSMKPSIPYHLWIEQPEGIPTALAIVPNNRPKALKKIFEEIGCTLWK